MKILYLGKFNLHYATENYVTHALRETGHSVIPYNTSNLLRCNNLIALTAHHKPDVVLFSKVEAAGFKEYIPWCKRNNIPTVCWLWDLYFGYRSDTPYQFNADILLTTDGGHKAYFEPYNHKVLRQGIHKPHHQILEADYRHDVAFVGHGANYTQRKNLVGWLRSTYGDGFIHHTSIRGLDLNKALSQAKIIVGDSYPAPGYASNRIYEITGRGGFLMHPESDAIDKEYTKGTHYIEYPRKNMDKLKNLIQYYLDHPEQREKIRRSGWEHTGTNYTYDHRVADLMRLIRDQFPSLRS